MESRSDFWKLIELVNSSALAREDEDAAVAPLIDALSNKPESELRLFQEHLACALYELDGESYFSASSEAAGSDDSFLYVRCYVVAKGEKFFNSVKLNPSKMPKSTSQWCESLLYVHSTAWAKSTGRPESEWPYEPSVSFETGSNTEQWSQDAIESKPKKPWWRFWSA